MWLQLRVVLAGALWPGQLFAVESVRRPGVLATFNMLAFSRPVAEGANLDFPDGFNHGFPWYCLSTISSLRCRLRADVRRDW